MYNLQDIINSKKNIYTIKITKKNINDELYNISNYDDILPEYFIIITPPNNKIYKFIFKLKINNKQVSIFNNIFNIPFRKIIHLSVINWLNSKIKNNIFKTFSNKLEQPGIAINYELCNTCKNKSINFLYCKKLDTTNIIYNITNKYKIHINIKLEYLFWTIEHIINNSKKFIIKVNKIKKPLFSFFKIHTDFYNFTILREKNSIYNNEKILYYPNIVFYQYDDLDPEITKLCFQKLVTTLLQLFPNNLNISSHIYSKYSFRLNNNIYLCIGDSYDKINKSNEYTIPLEYKQILDSCSQIKNPNKFSKKLSNHNLCKINNNKWITNDIDSIYYLVKKDNDSILNIFNEIGYDINKY